MSGFEVTVPLGELEPVTTPPHPTPVTEHPEGNVETRGAPSFAPPGRGTALLEGILAPARKMGRGACGRECERRGASGTSLPLSATLAQGVASGGAEVQDLQAKLKRAEAERDALQREVAGLKSNSGASRPSSLAPAAAVVAAAMPRQGNDRDPRHSKGGAGTGTKRKRSQSRGQRSTGSTVSTPQSIERARERTRRSGFFNSLAEGMFVTVVRNAMSGHHDITKKRPELLHTVCEIVSTAVYPGTWLSIKQKGGDQSTHFKVRTSQIRLCEQQPRKSTESSQNQRRQSSPPTVAAPRPTTSARNADGDGDGDSSSVAPGGAATAAVADRNPWPEPTFEVDEILATRKRPRQPREFLVAWAGFSEERNTWEPGEGLSGATEKLTAFWVTHHVTV